MKLPFAPRVQFSLRLDDVQVDVFTAALLTLPDRVPEAQYHPAMAARRFGIFAIFENFSGEIDEIEIRAEDVSLGALTIAGGSLAPLHRVLALGGAELMSR